MSNPLQNNPQQNSRKDTAQKVLAVADVIYELLRAILGVFGRRKSDSTGS